MESEDGRHKVNGCTVDEPDTVIWKLTKKVLRGCLRDLPALLDSCVSVGVASIMMERPKRKPQIVAFGTGNGCYANEKRSRPCDGRTVFDCRAMVVARRAFKRYLFEELMRFFDEPSCKEAIFERCKHSSKRLRLKDGVRFHLFMSASEGHTQSMRFPMLHSEDQVTSSLTGSAKLVEWSVIGMQGALLSHFVEAIYIRSVTVGQQIDLALPFASFLNILKGFEAGCQSEEIGRPAVLCTSIVIKGYHQQIPLECTSLSANWYLRSSGVEILDTDTGDVVPWSPYKSTIGGSRLCKSSFMRSFRQLCEKSGRFELMQGDTYKDLKVASKEYQMSKATLRDFLEMSGYVGSGYGMETKDVDLFTA